MPVVMDWDDNDRPPDLDDEHVPDSPVIWFEGWAQFAQALAPHVARLKAALAKRPTFWFFIIAVVPSVVSEIVPLRWITNWLHPTFWMLAAAMLVAWAGDERVKARTPGAIRTRLVLFLAGVLAVALIHPFWTWAYVKEANAVLNGGEPWHQPSLLRYFGFTFTSTRFLPTVVIVAWALSSMFCPRGCLRGVLASAEWRAPRSRYAFAVIAWPVTALVFAIGALAFVESRHEWGTTWAQAIPGYTLLTLPWLAISSALAAVAWFGIGARHMLARHSAVVVAIAIWIAQWADEWSFILRWELAQDRNYLTMLVLFNGYLATLAVIVVSLWCFGPRRRWLGAVIVFQTLASFTFQRVVAVLLQRHVPGLVPIEMFTALLCLLAIVVAWRGGLWRRPVGVDAGAAPVDTGAEAADAG
jgi:hypothetical protein